MHTTGVAVRGADIHTTSMLAFALVLGAGGASYAAAPGSIGSVTESQGSAFVTRQGGQSPTKAGDGIQLNDELTTGPGSKLAVQLADGAKLTLGPKGELVIDEFVYNPQGQGGGMALKVAGGAARFVAGAIEKTAGPQAISISTPVASIGIRGTDFFINLDGDHLQVALFSGVEVVVSNAAGSAILHPGEGTDVYGSARPTAARPWAPDRINNAGAQTTVTQWYERPMPYARAPALAYSLGDALTGGAMSADIRIRSEVVDQDSRRRSGEATTGRLRLNYETAGYYGFYLGLSGQTTHALDRTVRNDGVNRRVALPLIADPSADELKEAYLGWTAVDADGFAQTRAVVGRQRILYDNERWMGPSEFRQNAQSFDAITFETRLIPRFALRYAYIDKVHRVLGDNFGGRWKMASHLIGATTNVVPFGITTAYAYLLDNQTVPALSSATYGLRYEGVVPLAYYPGGDFNGLVELEVARQSQYGANPRTFELPYGKISAGFSWDKTQITGSYERLAGNGVVAVQTPLATLHRQNGWADVFTTTPANGLREVSARLLQELPDIGPLKGPKIDLRYLDFRSAGGVSQHYGKEWDADLNGSLNGWFTVGVRAARYSADRFDTNTMRVFTYLELRF